MPSRRRSPKRGSAARGATLYVNLEPCAHHGRTPPCVETVLASGVKRVVVAHRDPDPRTGGKGVERLRAAGVRVDVGVEAERALRLNSWFVIDRVESRPAVTLKWGASLDGKTATAPREPVDHRTASAAGRRCGCARSTTSSS